MGNGEWGIFKMGIFNSGNLLNGKKKEINKFFPFLVCSRAQKRIGGETPTLLLGDV